jgi:arylsulfatase A-like enzyme
MTGRLAPRLSMDCFIPASGEPRWVLFPGDAWGLDPGERSLAAVLRDAGYATGIVGKWHLGDQAPFLPRRHGFDRCYGIPYSNDMGPIDAFPGYPPLPLLDDDEVAQEQPDLAALTERLVEQAVGFLREHRHEPFFLYLAHFHPHVPNYAPAEFLRRSRNGRYGACVEQIDWSVAVLRHHLARLGLTENTLVVFTSDNGAADDRRLIGRGHAGSNAPLRGHKGTTFEGGQRVPCLAAWPGTIRPGRESGELATNLDFVPTFARLAGGHPPDDRVLDGRDLTDLLLAGGASPHRDFPYYRSGELQAVRDRRFKLHLSSGQLYDLLADPAETVDVATAEPGAVRTLVAVADRWRADLGDRRTGTLGAGVRPAGRVADPRPLAVPDPTVPHLVALYDLDPDEPGRFAAAAVKPPAPPASRPR